MFFRKGSDSRSMCRCSGSGEHVGVQSSTRGQSLWRWATRAAGAESEGGLTMGPMWVTQHPCFLLKNLTDAPLSCLQRKYFRDFREIPHRNYFLYLTTSVTIIIFNLWYKFRKKWMKIPLVFCLSVRNKPLPVLFSFMNKQTFSVMKEFNKLISREEQVLLKCLQMTDLHSPFCPLN